MTEEYIEREAAKHELLSGAVCANHPEYLMKDDALHVIDSIPAADVAPVRHGRWIKENSRKKSYLWICSNCRKIAYFCGGAGKCAYQYCPNCGARMDGGED